MRVVLLDGHHMVRRHYHVTPGLSDLDGNATGGLFGFLVGLARVIADLQPAVLLTIWDCGVDPFRKRIFPEYKNRQEKNPEKERQRLLDSQAVSWQVDELTSTVLPLIGVPVLRFQETEADDLIFLSRHLLFGPEAHYVIVSGDRDFYQMVEPGVTVYDPMKKQQRGFQPLVLTPDNFLEATGLPDAQAFLDFRIIAGDDSDKIPGIPGVADKTASAILTTFGSLKAAINSPDEVRALGKRHARILAEEAQPVLVRNTCLMDLSRRHYHEGEVEAIRDAIAATPRKMDLRTLDQYAKSRNAMQFSAELPRWAMTLDNQLARHRQSL